MGEQDFLAARFQADRAHLLAVAYRMLGSAAEAQDAVQEAWLRLNGADTTQVRNLTGWLTTVVGRVCLDMLRSRTARREDPLGDREPSGEPSTDGPEDQAVLADSVGLALLVVLDTLGPAERLAFVLHDMFGVPFEEIGPIVERSPAAARQLASRARRRVRGVTPDPDQDPHRRRAVVDAFLAASRGGDLEALLAVLDPDVVLRADPTAVASATANAARGAPDLAAEVRGAAAVARAFAGRAQATRPALVDGAPGAAWAPGGRPKALFEFTVSDGRVVALEIIADAERIAATEVVLLS